MSDQPDIKQAITGAEYAVTSGTGRAAIYIANYYYLQDPKIVPAESTVTTNNEKIPCPYRGLFHFGPDDAEFFFGREELIEELFVATKTHNFISVLGASGSGKSSVVLAGLVPKLQQSGNWLFAHFRPGSDPFYGLASALVPLYTPNLNATEQINQARQLASYFSEGNIFLADVFAQIHQNHPKLRILLIADQFEEIYTLCVDQKVRRSFLDTLLASFQPSPCHSQYDDVLIATMRADFLGNALLYPPFADILKTNMKLIRSMRRDELLQVIEKPAQKLGVTFEVGLVERVLDDLEDEPGNLALLEFTLTGLWEKRMGKKITHSAYEDMGGVKDALARHADKYYYKLNSIEQKQVQQIFIQLVYPGEGTQDTRRPSTKVELGNNKWSLVKDLADARLVVTSRNAIGQETVEVVHEALILNWDKFRQWMNIHRSFRVWQEKLRISVYQWMHSNQDKEVLLRGVILADAQEKLKQHQEDLSEEEQFFIEASVIQRDWELIRRSLARLIAFFGLAGILLLILGLVGLAGRWINTEISEIHSLLQSSDRLLNLDKRESSDRFLNLDRLRRRTAFESSIKALELSIKAAIKMQNRLWLYPGINTQVKLTLLNTVNNVATPNVLGGHAGIVNFISFNQDGKLLASASFDNTVKLWNAKTGKQIKTFFGHTDFIHAVSFSPDGKLLASASRDSTVKLWNISTGKLIKTLSGHTKNDWIYGVSFSPDGKILNSVGRKVVKRWNVDTGKEIKTLINDYIGRDISSLSSDGNILASVGDNIATLWNVKTGKQIKTLTLYKSVKSISLSSDGNILASFGDNTVTLWDVKTGKKIKTLVEYQVESISFSPDSKIFAFADSRGVIRLWDNITKEIKIVTGHTSSIYDISFSPDAKLLASGSRDSTVKLWNTSTGKLSKTLTGHKELVYNIVFSPNGKFLASASLDDTVKLWDTTTGKEIKTFIRNSFSSVSFSSDSKILAFADGKAIKLWNVRTLKLIKNLKAYERSKWGWKFFDRPGNISFSPYGKLLASQYNQKKVRLWHVDIDKPIKTPSLTEHDFEITHITFSPDGKLIASLGDSSTAKMIVKLWDTTTGQEIKISTGSYIRSISFSPDSKLIAAPGEDKTVKIWDATTGQEVKTFYMRKHIHVIRFSPDGKLIAFVPEYNSNVVFLWKWSFDYSLEEGCRFMRDYFKINPPDNEEDKHLCDSVSRS
ncbi:WD40 repeat domain-containing protein [Mastigocoleus sp. MO_188.B34]|uniref:NACHT and WD repeat domain-containing protein n=1 Tax=Mastigocoleus sp. MO_188.B34 TaxID=3036635 RepID=UPI0026280197|nr:WD40 repeat domain-containing protein [Mastigocoleus sp. MO_188.B34]MDJ0697774.1 WD40 repeat domain-containing protein [Mastigocoleus sp. MO_188.B34]